MGTELRRSDSRGRGQKLGQGQISGEGTELKGWEENSEGVGTELKGWDRFQAGWELWGSLMGTGM